MRPSPDSPATRHRLDGWVIFPVLAVSLVWSYWTTLREIVELNIGYYMIGEALFVGLGETVRAMRAAMDRGRSRA